MTIATVSVRNKYEKNGSYYLVIPTQENTLIELTCTQEDYDEIVCDSDHWYEVSYKYYNYFPWASTLYYIVDAEKGLFGS